MDYTPGRNLYVSDTAVNGYIYADASRITGMSGAREQTSLFIPVEGIDTVTIQCWVPSLGEAQQAWIGYAFYEEEDMTTHIGSRPSKYSAAGTPYLAYVGVSVPENAKYMRVAFRRFTDGYCMVEYGSEATAWRPAPEDITYDISGGGMDDPRS